MNDFVKHAREIKGYIDNHKYECAPDGVYFPAAKAMVFGEYTHSVNGGDERTDRNLLTLEGIACLLETSLGGAQAKAGWFLALYSGNYTPTSTVTAAQFPSAAGELVSPTEGYSESVRPLWRPDAAAAGLIENVTNKAVFSMVTATSVSIVGAALLSEQIKGATTGVLMSISRFSAAREQFAGDTFNLGYRVRLQAA